MNEQKLEDSIWRVTKEPKTKTNVWRAVGGDKQTCLNKINAMVQTSQLREKETGKNRAVTVTRIDSQNKANFEATLGFQVKKLEQWRESWSKLKGDKFDRLMIAVKTEPPLPFHNYNLKMKLEGLRYIRKKGLIEYKGEKYKIVDEIQIWKIKKSRKKTVDGNLETMGFYQNALLLFIARVELQRSLGLLTHSEAQRRTLKIQQALDKHMKKLLNLNPKETDALRQYISWKTFVIEGFRIA